MCDYDFSKKFISATTEMADFDNCVPSPYFRKTVFLTKPVSSAIIRICGLGFYKFWLNSLDLTKGFLSPYISNPDDVLDFDEYKVTEYLNVGKNVLAFQLGNGMQNAFGGFVWDFQLASFRSAPKLAVYFELNYLDGSKEIIEADDSFVTCDSPIIRDDLRLGEIYDANKEIFGWQNLDFDDSSWKNAILVSAPSGTPYLCMANPIKEYKTILPQKISLGEWFPCKSKTLHKGYIYDFGLNSAGIIELKVNGVKGQKITLTFGEILHDDMFFTDNITFTLPICDNFPDFIQQDVYICKGEQNEIYQPSFTYHGFRYVFVEGITEEQATCDLLTYKLFATQLDSRGYFNCSCDKLNRLQAMTINATISNFYHFPTDCPHREKNGWTADAALSCEQTLINFNPENNYYEWMRHIRSALNENGALPGIVPTSGWGFVWGNGPAWDQVIVELPLMTYRYTGNKKIVEENLDYIIKYLHYLYSRLDDKGLIAIGLGDWCAPYGIKSPLEFTDSVMSMVICQKASLLSNICGRKEDESFCNTFAQFLKNNIRKHLIDTNNCIAVGECQTSQALALYYEIFEPSEKEKAFNKLLDLISSNSNHMDTGVIGGRVILHLLAENGYADLAHKIIVEPTPPSYGYWLEKGYTALAEHFMDEKVDINSKNHHFWGDISAFFVKDICGIHYNPNFNDTNFVSFRPNFISNLQFANAKFESPSGLIETNWKRHDDSIIFEINLPKNMKYEIELPKGFYIHENLGCGKYLIKS